VPLVFSTEPVICRCARNLVKKRKISRGAQNDKPEEKGGFFEIPIKTQNLNIENQSLHFNLFM